MITPIVSTVSTLSMISTIYYIQNEVSSHYMTDLCILYSDASIIAEQTNDINDINGINDWYNTVKLKHGMM